jgi:hypothetical protein
MVKEYCIKYRYPLFIYSFMLLSTQYSQKLVDISDSISVPKPRTKRAKVPKIQAYTAKECSSVK